MVFLAFQPLLASKISDFDIACNIKIQNSQVRLNPVVTR